MRSINMSGSLSFHSAKSLAALQPDVERICAELGNLTKQLQELWSSAQSADLQGLEVLSLLKSISKIRASRTTYFPASLFSDAAWDILLYLKQAELEQRRVVVTDACLASGVPSSTALRWLKLMLEQEVIIRKADKLDARRVYVELHPQASKSMSDLMASALQDLNPKMEATTEHQQRCY